MAHKIYVRVNFFRLQRNLFDRINTEWLIFVSLKKDGAAFRRWKKNWRREWYMLAAIKKCVQRYFHIIYSNVENTPWELLGEEMVYEVCQGGGSN